LQQRDEDRVHAQLLVARLPPTFASPRAKQRSRHRLDQANHVLGLGVVSSDLQYAADQSERGFTRKLDASFTVDFR
jgi:hypothetical protein